MRRAWFGLKAAVLVAILLAVLAWVADDQARGQQYATTHLLALARLAAHNPGQGLDKAIWTIAAVPTTLQIGLAVVLLAVCYAMFSMFRSGSFLGKLAFRVAATVLALMVIAIVTLNVGLTAHQHWAYSALNFVFNWTGQHVISRLFPPIIPKK
ncbi:MAG: hypothetical protein M0Z41_08880 [Peptococcaceae bacterium]|nr:hypothetical protein [Peptococcaceae bacterium]